jgi:hypothetical protein
MIKFSQFITERKRTQDQANKLGSYLAKRHGGNIKLKHDPFAGMRVMHSMNSQGKKLHSSFAKEKTTTVKISDLHHTQSGVAWNAKEGKRKLKDHEPIEVIHYNGKHHIMNGHHRVIGHKLLGKTHIHAKVIHLKEPD